MLQRILERGEIESLDHNQIPRLRLPDRRTVFTERAARLRHLARSHAASDYLLLMARLVDAQHQALRSHETAPLDAEALALAQAHGMPPLQAAGRDRDPRWRDVLLALLGALEPDVAIPAQARLVMADLRRMIADNPEQLESLADAILAERDEDVSPEQAPFVMTALQVHWTARAGDFDLAQVPRSTPFGTCPLCGSLPVASIIRVGGAHDGYRYLCCSLCATEWHVVRVTCTHCENNKSILYHTVEGESGAVQAESCDECHSYRKTLNQDKDLDVEAVADDLASLTLDILMGQADYSRASGNPLLWQGAPAPI